MKIEGFSLDGVWNDNVGLHLYRVSESAIQRDTFYKAKIEAVDPVGYAIEDTRDAWIFLVSVMPKRGWTLIIGNTFKEFEKPFGGWWVSGELGDSRGQALGDKAKIEVRAQVDRMIESLERSKKALNGIGNREH